MEATDGWVTSTRASRPPWTLLGSLGGVEAGLRQLRRTRPLEVVVIDVPDAGPLRVPTLEEILRIKSYLVVQRNQVRDYLDVVALADTLSPAAAARTLVGIGSYYADRSDEDDSVLTVLTQRLAEPAPRDHPVTGQLTACKGLSERWQDWSVVTAACADLAEALLRSVEEETP